MVFYYFADAFGEYFRYHWTVAEEDTRLHFNYFTRLPHFTVIIFTSDVYHSSKKTFEPSHQKQVNYIASSTNLPGDPVCTLLCSNSTQEDNTTRKQFFLQKKLKLKQNISHCSLFTGRSRTGRRGRGQETWICQRDAI